MKVLIVTGGYVPGYRSGGPIRSLEALVDQLGDDIEFSIVTSATDAGDPKPYVGIKLDTWSQVGKARVWYTLDRRLSLGFWRRILEESVPDVVYLNSFFSSSTIGFLAWRRLGLIKGPKVLLAPRGEFSKGALNLKARKKQEYLKVARILRFYGDVVFHASTAYERSDIVRVLGPQVSCAVAPDLIKPTESELGIREKKAGEADFVWVSRISPKKNLVGAIESLMGTSSNARLTIYGPIEDEQYWIESQKVAGLLPANVRCEYGGELKHERVSRMLNKHQFFLFPTLGENFGHVIAEALNQGLPVVLSDQTPWRNLESERVGWDLPLGDSARWQRVVEECIQMKDDEYQEMSRLCKGFAEKWVNDQGGRDANLEMFRSVVAPRL